MTLPLKRFFVFAFLFCSQLAHAQPHDNVLPVAHEPEFFSASFNPLLLSGAARFTGDRFATADARAGFASDALDAGLVLGIYNSESIDKETLDRNYVRRDGLTATGNVSLSIGVSFGNDSALYSHGLFLRQRYDVYLDMSQALTGVLFYGNARYENETVAINGEGKFLGFRQLQYVISTKASSQWVLTASASVLQGLKVNEARYKGSLYTAPYGEYLDLDYDFHFKTFGTNNVASVRSMGLAFGAGVMHRSKDNRRHMALGLAEGGWFFNGIDARSYKADSAVRFEGFVVHNVFALNDSSFLNFGDTVANHFGVAHGNKTSTVELPARFYAHYVHRINRALDLSAAVEWQPVLPQLVHASLIAGRRFVPSLYTAVHLNTVSFSSVNVGLTLMHEYKLSSAHPRRKIQTTVQSRFVNALVAPKSARGFDLAVALAYRF
ncbi:MAG TPA: hypothetical protein VEY71_10365 [Chitinophagales bacterium]|nr:hypothetical protein [Chitinophagales bacterium]